MSRISLLMVLIFGVFLSGCSTIQSVAEAMQQAEQEKAQRYRASLRTQCMGFGFRDGTQQMASCMMQVDINNKQAEAVRSLRPPPPLFTDETDCRRGGWKWTGFVCQ
jgi:hypothetical protein